MARCAFAEASFVFIVHFAAFGLGAPSVLGLRAGSFLIENRSRHDWN